MAEIVQKTAANLKIDDNIVQSVTFDGLAQEQDLENYLNKNTGGEISGDIKILFNFQQGVSITQGTGTSCDSDGIPSQTEMEGIKATALNSSKSLGENSFAANVAEAFGKNSTAFGNSKAFASYSIAHGAAVSAMGYASHAEGRQTQTGLPWKIGSSSTLQDYGAFAHAEGCSTSAVGMHSHAEGRNSWSEGPNSHAEGEEISAIGYASHAEGSNVIANGRFSHAEGYKSTTESDYSHAEGDQCLAKGESSHAEGYMSTAEGVCSHAEGDQCLAKGQKSHAEGESVSAIGFASHAEGRDTVAEATCSHAEGACAKVLSGHNYSFVWSGRYNQSHNYYQSRDVGTFCVNPQNGLSGFYVGNESMASLLAGRASKEELAEMYLSAQTMYNGFILGCVGALSAANAVSSMVVESQAHPGKNTLLIVPTGYLTDSSGAILQQVPAAQTFVMAVGALISAISLAGSQYYDGQLA